MSRAAIHLSAVHPNKDQLIEHMYCEADVIAEHLSACSKCRGRFAEIERCYAHQAERFSPSAEFFQRQRRAIVGRIDNPPPRSAFGNIWVPSSLALVLAVGLVVGRAYTASSKHHPNLEPAVENTASDFLEILEPGWFDETYTAMQIAEPLAASPIVNLFAQPPIRE